MKTILITGSGGLVGSQAVEYFGLKTNTIVGIDNNNRAKWFGDKGCVSQSIEKNKKFCNYEHHCIDIANYNNISEIFRKNQFDAIIHCAGQPSHEFSAVMPYDDFLTNTVGTMNLLTATKIYCPDAPFIFTSTNKVYGDNPNKLPITESAFRFDFYETNGINEKMSIDNCIHSPFGANKAAADLIVQEYGKYFGLNTVCFRCGCITGKNHQSVEQHGFLNYICKIVKNKEPYTIYGYKGKQVRDNIHAYDLVTAFDEFIQNPKKGEVYNIGGGKENSISIMEVLKNTSTPITFADARIGDHICYYTDYTKFKNHYPNWKITRSINDIMKELL